MARDGAVVEGVLVVGAGVDGIAVDGASVDITVGVTVENVVDGASVGSVWVATEDGIAVDNEPLVGELLASDGAVVKGLLVVGASEDGSALGSSLGDTLGALDGAADGAELGTALGFKDGW